MKKTIAASVFSIAITSGSAFAGNNSGDVQFVGVVTDTTCDIVPVVNGAPNSIVNIGTATTINGSNSTSTPVVFALQPANGTVCGDVSLTNAEFNFYGQTLNGSGFGNNTGTATDSYMNLIALNSVVTNDTITQTDNTATVTLANLNSEGLRLQAQLFGGQIPGTYESSMTYTVNYN